MSGLVSALENSCTTFCLHNAVKRAFKSRSISNGLDITNNLRQNRGMIAICVFLGLFRRWITCALRFTCKLEWKDFKRRSISNGIEITINLLQNPRMIAMCVFLGLFRRWEASALHIACKLEWKKRLNVKVISGGRDKSLNFFQNRRMIAICVFLGLFRRWKSYALRSACKMEWKERLNVEISQTGKKYRLIFVEISE